ncbi:MAG: DMT family transporter [Campylobacteraceae bacterium]|nr:DMT family transporter [Campylobacteraceae bacterium]
MSKTLLAKISLILIAIGWGGTFLPIQMTLEYINVPSFLFFRFLFAGVLMWLVSLKFGLKFDKNSIKFGLILGVFMFLDFIFQISALNFTFSSTVAFIIGLNVVIVPFLIFFIFKFELKFKVIVSAVLATAGLFLLSGTKGLSLGFGEALALISAFAYALHVVYTGRFITKSNIYALLITQFFTVSFLTLFYAIFFASPSESSQNILGGFEIWLDVRFIYILLFTVLFATIIAFFVQTKAQIYLTPSQTSLILTLEPVSAGFIGYFIGKEFLSLAQILGAVLILSAILISELKVENKP